MLKQRDSIAFKGAYAVAAFIAVYRTLFVVLHNFRVSRIQRKAKKAKTKLARLIRNCTMSRSFPPLVSGVVASLTLSKYPVLEHRRTIAVYLFTRMLEFTYNFLADFGFVPTNSSFWGSWMLFPFCAGQLFHTFIFNPDCFPNVSSIFVLLNFFTDLIGLPRVYFTLQQGIYRSKT